MSGQPWRPHADPIDWEARAHAAEATLTAVVSEVEEWEADAAAYIGTWGQHLPCTVPTMAEKIRAVLQRGPEVATKPVPDLAEAERERRIGIINDWAPQLYRGFAQIRTTGDEPISVCLPERLNPNPGGVSGKEELARFYGLPVHWRQAGDEAHVHGTSDALYTIIIEEKP